MVDGRYHGRCSMGDAQVLPVSIAWLLAILSRLLITGCLHEDGLADFFDGFGGGTTKERTLAIMKDSQIGSYGVIGLIGYFLLLFLLLENLPLKLICALVICGDCWSKFCASQIINYLPYARKEEDSKAKVVYDRMTWQELLTGFICGLLPIVLFLPIDFWPVTICPILTFIILYRLMKRRLKVIRETAAELHSCFVNYHSIWVPLSCYMSISGTVILTLSMLI